MPARNPRTTLLVLTALAVAGCCSSSEDPPGAEAHDEEFRRCAVLDASGGESYARGAYRYGRDGHELDVQGPKDGVARIGALAGLEGADRASIASISELVSRLVAASAEAIVVAGGIGTDEASARAVLGPLARLEVPVLLVPGASEPIDAFRSALRAAREKAPNLIDMGIVRVARLPDVTVVSLPGGPRAHELNAGEDGCGLTAEDVESFGQLVRERPDALVVSATPPSQRGIAAIDVGRSGVGAGDPSVARAVARARLGVFGYVYESGGRAAGRSGHRAVAEGAWSEELFLNVGAADALPRALIDGTLAAGMAGLLEIQGRRARHRMLRTGN